MTYKTEADFYALLEQWTKTGSIPNGRPVGRGAVVNYILYESDLKFISMFGKEIRGGGIETWYKKYTAGAHRNSRIANIEGVNYPHQTPQEYPQDTPQDKQGIDPSINILDDDLDLDEGLTDGDDPYEIQPGEKKYLIISDIHLPYHNLKSLRLAINYGRTIGVNGIILNGDICDFYGISRHSRKPDKPTIRYEIELCKQFLEQLRKLFPSEHIIYKIGNHENRLERYIYDRCPELFGIDALSLAELLKLKDLNIHLVKSTQLIKAGKLWIAHGHEFMGGGVLIARSTRMKAGDNILIGHHHKTQSDFAKNISDDVIGGWSVGCLCDLRPDYLPVNQWNHGFAIVSLSHDGSFTVQNKKIVEGVVR